ncbi:MAG: glycosyltransferase family 4 protein, partial [Thermoanaerobaculia bacterium]|nr:glycosyltransferase family 4 protein [Thermoanaerobaculia bacterium]
MTRRICICSAQVPFVRGGAENLAESLRDELVRRGFPAEIVTLPFNWSSRTRILKSALAWRMIDLTESVEGPIDLVIATRFPSYVVRHPNKVVWLVHQLRQIYDLKGTRYSDFGDAPEDENTAELVRGIDRRCLSEARRLFAISRNTADRLERFNDLRAESLYPPPKLGDLCRPGPTGDYVLGVGRLDAMKRFDLLIRAMDRTSSPVRCKIAGAGPERGSLEALIEKRGLGDRVELLGWVEDDRLAELYSGSLGVYFAPWDEDYGYITVEAFKSAKPVLTTDDAGAVLEFVEDGVNGFVCEASSPRQLGRR